MLIVLKKLNKFIINFNITRIGCNDCKDHKNIKLIDYNYHTIYDWTNSGVDLLTQCDTINCFNKALDGEESLIPKYFKKENINHSNLHEYDKFSIPGIINLIDCLKGTKIEKKTIISNLKLENTKYSEVSSYEDILQYFIDNKTKILP